MTPRNERSERIMAFEGQILQISGHRTADFAADYARDVIDGAANALIRIIQGSRSAADFVFALSDRLVGQLRFWMAFAAGLVCGLLLIGLALRP